MLESSEQSRPNFSQDKNSLSAGLYGFGSMIRVAQITKNPIFAAIVVLPIFALVASVFTACSFGSGGGSSDSSRENVASKTEIAATLNDLQVALDSWRENERITGASMSVFSAATGQLDLASGVAKRSIDPDRFPDEILTVDRPMFAGDLTHTLVAALVIQLARQGALTLDSPIAEWFPEIEQASRITIRNLLEHTSGIPVFYTEDFLDVLYEQEPNLAQSPDDVIAVAAAASGGSYFSPGTQYGYSKTNFLILGRVIEMVTGQPLEAELRDSFFEPLGLDNTYLAGRENIPGSTPLGYEYAGPGTNAPTAVDGHVPQTPAISVISAEWASGALVSTPRDITRLVQAIFEPQEFPEFPELEGVAQEMLRIADHPAQESGPVRVDSGAGVFVWTENGKQVVGQFGFLYPFSAQFTYWPESGSGPGIIIVVMANEVDSSRNPNSNFQLPVIEDLTKGAKRILDAVQKGRPAR